MSFLNPNDDNFFENLIKKIDEKRNVFLTGGAGVGKTFTVARIIEHYGKKKDIAKTALTGIAALHIKGQTIHKFAGTGITNNPDELSTIIKKTFFEKAQENIRFTDIIIIDEISMMSKNFFSLLDLVFKTATGKHNTAFGGKQLIILGDFLQLPPVIKNKEERKDFWAFESDAWKSLNLLTINLREVKRQNDKTFSTVLNMVRAGINNLKISKYFQMSQVNKFPDEIKPIKLMATNKYVDNWNETCLKLRTEKEEIFKCEIEASDEKKKAALLRDCTAPEILKLKDGCQVMLLKNCPNGAYVNGSMGIYKGMDHEHGIYNSYTMETEYTPCLIIQLLDSDRTVYVPRATWELLRTETHNGEKIQFIDAQLSQYPVKLGYAITMHKSQGMSIDFLEVDARSVFADGQFYVAVSRARTYTGLRVLNFSPDIIKINKKAYNFYLELNKSEKNITE